MTRHAVHRPRYTLQVMGNTHDTAMLTSALSETAHRQRYTCKRIHTIFISQLSRIITHPPCIFARGVWSTCMRGAKLTRIKPPAVHLCVRGRVPLLWK